MEKHAKDILYEFFQEPSRENFTHMINWNTGEQDNIDFKEKWIFDTKLCEIMLGMANCGGGVIIFGVKEKKDGTVEAVGLENLEDKADIESKNKKYLPESFKFKVYDFDYSGEEYSKLKDKKFQVVVVESNDEDLPYIWNKDSNGTEVGCVFVRRGTKTHKANSVELKRIIEKRIRASYTDGSSLELEEHLKQLKVLYGFISRSKSYFELGEQLGVNLAKLFSTVIPDVKHEPNEYYPDEEYEEFIRRMIDRKKLKIEKVLDLK